MPPSPRADPRRAAGRRERDGQWPRGSHRSLRLAYAGAATHLKQVNVNVLSETDAIKSAENIDIMIRFPVFQVEKPVSQWSYNFNLTDFKQAVQHANENCTPDRLMALIDQQN